MEIRAHDSSLVNEREIKNSRMNESMKTRRHGAMKEEFKRSFPDYTAHMNWLEETEWFVLPLKKDYPLG